MAEPKDAEGILECLARAFEQFRARYTPEAFADTTLDKGSLGERMRSMVLFVATVEGRIAGTIGCQVLGGGEGHLRGMAVLPEWQGSDVAERLLSEAESELRGRGVVRVTLDTTEPLQRAARFYEKRGYVRSGRTSDFFGMVLFEYEKTLTSV